MSAAEVLRGRLVLTVPEAGRLLWGLGRDASYAAAERGEIPVLKVGRRLVVPTHAALKKLAMSDELIAIALGLAPERASNEAATAPSLAEVHALTKDHEQGNHAPDPAA